MAIPSSFIDELISRVDIVSIISRYISLKKSGSNYFGLCPFHGERTPSFSVSPSKQIYHCFGCGVGGSVINFIMEIEGLSFVDAIKFLAKDQNMTVPEDQYSKEFTSSREKTLEINKKTAKYFYENLYKPENKHIINYLTSRGINKKLATDFGIGFANNSYNDLLNYLTSLGYTQTELLKAGVISKNDKGNVYDKFRNRVMFPIIDVRSNVIAFGGRVLDDSTPKYLNSPETDAFSKSQNLFALNMAKKSKKGFIILAEGYMDVIALFKAGFDCAVACLGTSLTEGHARLLLRYTKDIVIAFDADNAGQTAAERAIAILKKSGFNIKVLSLKGAKDPDEYILKFGATSFENLIEKSENDTQYKFDKILNRFNLEQDTQKIDAITQVLNMIIELYSDVEKEIFINKLAQKTNISADALKLEYKKLLKTKYKRNVTKSKRQNMSPVNNIKPKDIIYDDIKSARSEEGIISLLFTDCTLLDKIELDENRFSVDILKTVYIFIKNLYAKKGQININYLNEILDNNQMGYLTKVINTPQNLAEGEKALSDYIYIINEQYAKRTNNLSLLLELKKTKE